MGSFRLPETDHPHTEPPRPPLGGPTGLGTAAARLLLTRPEDAAPAPPKPKPKPAEQEPAGGGVKVPELYCPDAVRDDPALGEEVNDRLVAWAEEIGIYQGRLDGLAECKFGHLIMLGHPDCDDPDRLMGAGKGARSEWAGDEQWVRG